MSLNIRVKTALCLLVIASGLFLFADSGLAVKMNVDPPRVELAIAAGSDQGGYISVLNYDDAGPIHVKAYVNDLVYLPDGSNDFLTAGTTPWSIADWLKISPTEFDIPAGGEGKVRYVVEVPEATTGGRYGVVFFEISPSLKEFKDRTGAAVNIRIGSIFLVSVQGTETYSASLQDLVIGKPDQDQSFEITCNVKNDGNILVRPSGAVKIFDSAKNEITELEINEANSGVLPGTSRQFSAKYDRSQMAAGEYIAQAVLDYGGDVLLGGQVSFAVE